MDGDHPAVEVRGLYKRYGDRFVVDDVDLEVQHGEIVGLLGANGAGKTTTVECVQGLRRPDAGTLRVLGLDPSRDGRRLRPLIGSQLQESGLPDRLRISEAIHMFAYEPGRSADALLEAFGLAPLRSQPVVALSGGQRQRLYLVLALLNRPRLVILDELTQGLDPAARRDVWDALQALRSAGTTVLLVTHYMEEAEALCDRVAVMAYGRVIDSGTPRQLVDRHARWSTLRFTTAEPRRWHDRLAPLCGVKAVSHDHGSVEVRGDRAMVAFVGAELVRRGEVPADLWVKSPDLEEAVLALLAAAPAPERVEGPR